MERAAIILFLSLGLALPAVADTVVVPSTETTAKGIPITLSDEQKQLVIDAAVKANSRQKTPKEFSPALGENIPKGVYLHGFRPETVQKMPMLKEYWYAFLDREVVLVGGSKSKIAAVVDLPQRLIAGEQSYQGATEPKSSDPAATVPSHTSPETIK